MERLGLSPDRSEPLIVRARPTRSDEHHRCRFSAYPAYSCHKSGDFFLKSGNRVAAKSCGESRLAVAEVAVSAGDRARRRSVRRVDSSLGSSRQSHSARCRDCVPSRRPPPFRLFTVVVVAAMIFVAALAAVFTFAFLSRPLRRTPLVLKRLAPAKKAP